MREVLGPQGKDRDHPQDGGHHHAFHTLGNAHAFAQIGLSRY
jgi:hypothetical protein